MGVSFTSAPDDVVKYTLVAMGFDFRLSFSDPEWYPANRERLADRIRGLPRFREEPASDEFRLKDDDNVESSWPYDLRIFLRSAGVDLEVSMATATFHTDVRVLLDWIRRETPVQVVDDDGVPVALGS